MAWWRRCSICKKEIGYDTPYYVCSVSTCQGKRTGYIFCSVACWDGHLGFARHREAYAEERTSPLSGEEREQPSRIGDVSERRGTMTEEKNAGNDGEKVETLVVVSRVKQFIRENAALNTSQCAVDALSKKVSEICLTAIERAKGSGRKTVMGRDVE